MRVFRIDFNQPTRSDFKSLAVWLISFSISLLTNYCAIADEENTAEITAVLHDEAINSPSQPINQQFGAVEIPAWWIEETMVQTRPESTVLPLTLESLLVRSVTHSSQIKVFSELPLIRRTAVTEADAAFDWAAFLDSQWTDTSDPVGSLLTGATGRYKNNQLSTTGGVRKRTAVGGVVEASQQLGGQQTNSTFFSPNPQATSRLKLSYTHPVLRGNGVLYNASLSCLALIDTNVAEAEFSRQVQAQLSEVARAYWGLHVARASVVIRNQSLERARLVLSQLKDREGFDAVRPQILRAEAEVAARESALTRATMMVRNSEAQIRSLVNDPELGSYSSTEFITLDAPSATEIQVDMRQCCEAALVNRPEVHQSLDQIRAACIRLRMSKQEMLPILNVVTEAYVAGLHDDAAVGDAWTNQFALGSPGTALGAEFEVPLGRRAAQAQRQRRILECRQLRNQYETTLHSLRLEVGVAVREVKATWAEINARKLAFEANQIQLTSTTERWKLLPGEDGNGALMLESMLRDQERLTLAEIALLESWISYNMSLFGLRKATGELLQSEQITWADYQAECDAPKARVIHKPDLGVTPNPLHTVSQNKSSRIVQRP